MTLLADHSTMLSKDFYFCLKIWNFKTFINEKISTFKKQCLLVRVQLHFCYQWLKKRIKTGDKTKLSNRRRRFTVTIIDSALIFYKVAALLCTAFDWQFNELENKKFEKFIINVIAVLNKTTVQELKGYFFVCTQSWRRVSICSRYSCTRECITLIAAAFGLTAPIIKDNPYNCNQIHLLGLWANLSFMMIRMIRPSVFSADNWKIKLEISWIWFCPLVELKEFRYRRECDENKRNSILNDNKEKRN